MIIRPGRVGDMVEILALERSSEEAPHWGEAVYAGLLAGPGSGAVRREVFCCDAESGLAGFAVGVVIDAGEGGRGEIENVVVDAVARRRGVGRTLCGAVLGWCREQGATEVGLEVRVSSRAAIALYASLGFVEVGRRKGYYNRPLEDALEMALRWDEVG